MIGLVKRGEQLQLTPTILVVFVVSTETAELNVN